jgi:hypothetical protein
MFGGLKYHSYIYPIIIKTHITMEEIKFNEKSKKVCTNCGCPEPEKRYDHFWCKVCHNEMN